MIEEIRAHVAERIEDLDGVIALRRTTEGVAPFVFQENDDLSQLVIEPRYPLAPLVSLLQKRYPEARLGIVARGCDTRALVEMVKRNQIDPDRLYILGVACTEDQAESCYCDKPAPDLTAWPEAELIGEPVAGAGPNPLVAEYEQMSLEERREFWQAQFKKCVKCFGCRDACPVCFCEACALEDPLWVEPGELAPPFPMYHLIKAMHMSGRCVACRQCEAVCPAHIPLTVLYDLIRQDVEDLMGYVPGMDLEVAPPLPLTLEEAPIETDVE